jgi:hypothetical protein
MRHSNVTDRIASKKRRATMKNINSTKHAFAVKLILGVLMAAFAFTAAANAQQAFAGKFELPEEVHWNHAVLPAGEYYIEMRTIDSPVVLHSVSTQKSFITGIPTKGDLQKGSAYLTITAHGNERRVRSLSVPRFNQTLIFEPLTNAEMESMAKAGQIETVPVFTAQK